MKKFLLILFVVGYLFVGFGDSYGQGLTPTLAVSPTAVPTAKWSDPTGEDPAKLKDLEVIFERIVKIAGVGAGFALFVMILVGGFAFLTSGGDPKKAEQGRNTLTFAVLGLVLLIGAYLILRFVAEFTGVSSILKFKIPGD